MDTATTRPRGRPRTFDQDVVLDALMGLFWRQGYEATSMTDIVEATGLNKSSLYNSFGSKREMFDLVLERYIDMRMTMLGEMVDAADDGVAGLHAFLETIRSEVETEFGRQGCLAVNTTAELGAAQDVITSSQDFRDRTRAFLVDIVRRAGERSGLDTSLAESRADMLLAFMLGLSVTVRGGATSAEIDRLIDAAHTTVDTWT